MCNYVQGESAARSMRKAIAEGIIQEPRKYTEVMLGMPPVNYVEWIKNDLNWGGENEICMLCEVQFSKFQIAPLLCKMP